jgi:hypothetical protein
MKDEGDKISFDGHEYALICGSPNSNDLSG